jgi:hypothetical protein
LLYKTAVASHRVQQDFRFLLFLLETDDDDAKLLGMGEEDGDPGLVDEDWTVGAPDDREDRSTLDVDEGRRIVAVAVENEGSVGREREERESKGYFSAGEDESTRADNVEERFKVDRRSAKGEPKGFDRESAAVKDNLRELDGWVGVVSDGVPRPRVHLGQIHLQISNEPQLPHLPLKHLSLSAFLPRPFLLVRPDFSAAPAVEALLQFDIRAEDELGIKLAKGDLADVGVGEAESAKSLSAGERDDEVAKLDGYWGEGEGHGCEEGGEIG